MLLPLHMNLGLTGLGSSGLVGIIDPPMIAGVGIGNFNKIDGNIRDVGGSRKALQRIATTWNTMSVSTGAMTKDPLVDSPDGYLSVTIEGVVYQLPIYTELL